MLFRLLLLICCLVSVFSFRAEQSFSWDGATVYFLITDRFCNGDSTNDVNYGRKTDYGSEQLNAATFHGGDFAGVLKKARERYFTRLGVDVVWLTDVYEQIHGWMTGSGAVNDFPHYGYHGYYPLDYTQMDKNFGTIDEFRELVDTLHARGIRVMLGANLNDPGYPTLLDAVQYGFAETGLSEEEAAKHIRDWNYDRFFDGRLGWKGWYDREWIRMPDEDWDENNPLEATLYGMPDYKDENDNPVRIPDFLKRKWSKEGKGNDPWVNPSARNLRNDREMVNFFFPKHGDLDGIVRTWQAYSDSIAAHPGWHPFSYLNNSYHRDADMANMRNCGTTLLLAPGAVQLFYGDECGRKLSDARYNVDSDQAFRSDMDWEDMDGKLLEHFRKLGQIRITNPVIATGRQTTLDVHACLRENEWDKVLIRLFPENGTPIDVSGVFSEGAALVELYSGEEATVKDGIAAFPPRLSEVAVIRMK